MRLLFLKIVAPVGRFVGAGRKRLHESWVVQGIHREGGEIVGGE